MTCLFEVECKNVDYPLQARDSFAFSSEILGESRHALLKGAVSRAKVLHSLGDVAASSNFSAELVLEVCVPVCQQPPFHLGFFGE